MPKTAALKTSAVTNWLVDWLLAAERSDLGETHEGEAREGGDVGLHWDVPCGGRRGRVVRSSTDGRV